MSVVEARAATIGVEGRRRVRGWIAGSIAALVLVAAAIVAIVQADSGTTGIVTTKANRTVSLVNRGLVPRATLQPASRLDDDLQRLKSLVNHGHVPRQTLEP
jgi:hypothetical protein